ncbi:MAG: hypothetical protein M3Z00_11705, partial [Actinomycetota bacterium]|nr:hypothetical protein [Actinomycetota bacterium]
MRIPRSALAAVIVLVAGCTSAPAAPPGRSSPPPASIGTAAPPAPSSGPGTADASTGPAQPESRQPAAPTSSTAEAHRSSPPAKKLRSALPGMPPVLDPSNVYSASAADKLAPQVRRDPAYAYVPHNGSSDVWVIDQHTHAVIRRCFLGGELQHVVPSFDLRQLYATSDTGNKIMVINPATGRCGRIIPVIDPYNLYFTPD